MYSKNIYICIKYIFHMCFMQMCMYIHNMYMIYSVCLYVYACLYISKYVSKTLFVDCYGIVFRTNHWIQLVLINKLICSSQEKTIFPTLSHADLTLVFEGTRPPGLSLIALQLDWRSSRQEINHVWYWKPRHSSQRLKNSEVKDLGTEPTNTTLLSEHNL